MMSVYRPKLQLSSLHQQPLCLCIILWMETRSIRWVTLLLFIIIYVNRTKGTQRMMQKSTEKEKKTRWRMNSLWSIQLLERSREQAVKQGGHMFCWRTFLFSHQTHTYQTVTRRSLKYTSGCLARFYHFILLFWFRVARVQTMDVHFVHLSPIFLQGESKSTEFGFYFWHQPVDFEVL